MQVKKQQLELDMEQQTGSKLGKEYVKVVYCHPAYLTCIQEYIMQNAGLDETQARIKMKGEISITSDTQMTPPYGRKQRGTKEPLNEGERGE